MDFFLFTTLFALTSANMVTIDYNQFEELITPTISFSEEATIALNNAALGGSIHTAISYALPAQDTDSDSLDISDLFESMWNLWGYNDNSGVLARFVKMPHGSAGIESLVNAIYDSFYAWKKPIVGSYNHENKTVVLRPVRGEVYAVQPIYRFYLGLYEAMAVDQIAEYNSFPCDGSEGSAIVTVSGKIRQLLSDSTQNFPCSNDPLQGGAGFEQDFVGEFCTTPIMYSPQTYFTFFSDYTYFAFTPPYPTSYKLTDVPEMEPIYVQALEDLGMRMWSQYSAAFVVTTFTVTPASDDQLAILPVPSNREYLRNFGTICESYDAGDYITMQTSSAMSEAPYDTIFYGLDDDGAPSAIFSTAIAPASQARTVLPEQDYEQTIQFPQEDASWISKRLDRLEALTERLSRAHGTIESTNKLVHAVARFLPNRVKRFILD